MFSFLRKKSKSKTESPAQDEQHTEQLPESHPEPVAAEPIPAPVAEPAVEPEKEKVSLFGRLKKGLSKTSSKLTEGLASLVLGKKTIDDDLLEELEMQLLTADLGVEATQTNISDLTQRVARKQLDDADALFEAMHDDMVKLLQPSCQPLVIPEQQGPFVILMVGINGVGKTTTIGKLAKQFQNQGKSVMLAAGDTFRAAAVEQLQVWGERNNIDVVSQHSGADSASVIYDALQSAKAKNIDILIADTAGRLHTQSNLMED